MTPPLIITRGHDTLIVKQRADGYDLTVSGGGNITASEFDQIAAFATGSGSDVFLAKLQARMARG